MNVNCCLLSGRLTKDAELFTTKKGDPMGKFRLAVNDRRRDNTLFINILCFGKMAETLQPMLMKGRLVSVQGTLDVKTESHEDTEKVKQNKTSVCLLSNEISLGPDPSTIVNLDT